MEQFDVVLINTPLVRYGFNLSGVYSIPHLGLGYLGAVLDREGYRLAYLNAQQERENPVVHPAVLPEAPVYLLTAKITNLVPTHEIAATIRRLRPTARIALGGPCNIIKPEILFELFPHFDLLATGEGEKMVAPLVRAMLAGGPADLRGVPGLAIRTSEGVVRTPPVEPADLNEPLFPLRRLWRRHRLRLHPPYGVYPPATLMETARGCSYNCRFCCISKMPRERPDEIVVEEVQRLVLEEGIREIHFVDPTFTLNPERTARLCEAFRNLPRSFKWSCKTRPDCVDGTLLRRMAEAGCYLLAYGIESAATDVLERVQKSLDPETTKRALDRTHEAGIRSIGYVLVGAPGETGATISRTNRFIRHNKVWFMLYGIYLPLPEDPNDPVREKELARFYTTGRSPMFARLAPAGFTHRRLHFWLLRSILSFYLNPASVWRMVRGIRSWGEMAHYTKGAGLLAVELGRFVLRRIFKTAGRRTFFSDGMEAQRSGEAPR